MSGYLTTWLRNASSVIHLTCEQGVADDISLKLDEAADEIDRLVAEVARLTAALNFLDLAAVDEITSLTAEVAHLREAMSAIADQLRGTDQAVAYAIARTALPKEPA